LVSQILIETKKILLNSKPRKFFEFSFEIHSESEEVSIEKVVHLFETFKTIFYFKFFLARGSTFRIGQRLNDFEITWTNLNLFERCLTPSTGTVLCGPTCQRLPLLCFEAVQCAGVLPARARRLRAITDRRYSPVKPEAPPHPFPHCVAPSTRPDPLPLCLFPRHHRAPLKGCRTHHRLFSHALPFSL
jgi:hypothetical protein